MAILLGETFGKLMKIDAEITFRKLEIFMAFMEKGNIARTAETLGISGVSVHRALHTLEEGVRCPLFSDWLNAVFRTTGPVGAASSPHPLSKIVAATAVATSEIFGKTCLKCCILQTPLSMISVRYYSVWKSFTHQTHAE